MNDDKSTAVFFSDDDEEPVNVFDEGSTSIMFSVNIEEPEIDSDSMFSRN